MMVVRRARRARRIGRSMSARTGRTISTRSCEGWIAVSPRSVRPVYPPGWGIARRRTRGARVVSVVVMMVPVMMMRLRRPMRTGTVMSCWSAWRWSRGMFVMVVVRE
jgi:hypothetical protein